MNKNGMFDEERKQKCESRYNTLETQIDDIYYKNVNVNWGPTMRKSTISKLVSMCFYYDTDEDISYISFNMDSSGRKAIYQEKNGVFKAIYIENDDGSSEEVLRSVSVVVGLSGDPTPHAIDEFNDMERGMPELRKLPHIAFGYQDQ